jgi:hypothetical protein
MPPEANPNCHCESHLEKFETDTTFNIPAKRLFEILFGSNEEHAGFYEEFHNKRGEFDRASEPWIEPVPESAIIGGEPTNPIAYRQVKFMMPINNPLSKCSNDAYWIQFNVLISEKQRSGCRRKLVPASA